MLREIFDPEGLPTHTYIKREGGKNEKSLKRYLTFSSKIITIYGPSKTGKSSLYKKVLKEIKKEPLVVKCANITHLSQIWKIALEDINFTRITNTSKSSDHSVKGSLKSGLIWIFSEIGFEYDYKRSVNENKEFILSEVSPTHLIPILRKLNYVLVLEELHYLNSKLLIPLFQQWKSFPEQEVSTIIVSTNFNKIDITSYNPDLENREVQIELARWSSNDLKKIVVNGFNEIGLKINNHLADLIATQSFGLPILTQEICLQLSDYCTSKELKIIERENVLTIFHQVAQSNFNTFANKYEIISNAINIDRFQSLHIALTAFNQDPFKHILKIPDMIERIKDLKDKHQNNNLTEESLNNYFSELDKAQKKFDLNLFFWDSTSYQLHFKNPSFMFYIRWEKERDDIMSTNELLMKFKIDLNNF